MLLSNKLVADKVFEALRALHSTHPRLAKRMEGKVESVLYPEKMLDMILEQTLAHDIDEHFKSLLFLDLYPGRAERVLKIMFEFAVKANVNSDDIRQEGFERKLALFAQQASPYLSAEEAIMRGLRSEIANRLWLHFWKDLDQESLKNVLSFALLRGDVEFTRHVLQANALFPKQMIAVVKLIKNGAYNYDFVSREHISNALHCYDQLLYQEVLFNDAYKFRNSFWLSLSKNKKGLPQVGNFIDSKRLKEKIELDIRLPEQKIKHEPRLKPQRF